MEKRGNFLKVSGRKDGEEKDLNLKQTKNKTQKNTKENLIAGPL